MTPRSQASVDRIALRNSGEADDLTNVRPFPL